MVSWVATSKFCFSSTERYNTGLWVSPRSPAESLEESPIIDAESVIRHTLELEQQLPSDLLDKLKENLEHSEPALTSSLY